MKIKLVFVLLVLIADIMTVKVKQSQSNTVTTALAVDDKLNTKIYIQVLANKDRRAAGKGVASIANNDFASDDELLAFVDATGKDVSKATILKDNTKDFEENENDKIVTSNILRQANYFDAYEDFIENQTEDQYSIIKDETIRGDKSYVFTSTKNEAIIAYNDTTNVDYKVLDTDYDREINIYFEVGREKLIVKRVFGDDEPPIIITASKFIKNSFTAADVKIVKRFYKDKCNCYNLRRFLINLLSI